MAPGPAGGHGQARPDFVPVADEDTRSMTRCPSASGPAILRASNQDSVSQPRRPALRPSLGRRVASVAAAALIGITSALQPAQAQGGLPLVRDAETEELMRDYAAPIFDAAGISRQQVEIILVNRNDFNAFVADARRIFINVGVILDAETPGEVIGVLAHETGHITGNHLVRLRQALANAQIMAAIGVLLGAGAAAAGSAGGGAGATGQSAKGMLKTFSRFADQSLFSAQYTDPYSISHPMPRERLNALETLARQSRYFNKPADPALQARHDLVRAKLLAFTSHPNVGQALLESGNPKAAVEPFRRAVALRPREGQLNIWLGFALVASNSNSLLPEAERILKAGLQMDPNSPIGYSQLAIAQGRQGKTAEADLSTARGLMARGDFRAAKRYAARAQKKLKRGTPAWLQADDIVSYSPPDFAKRR
eukprot:jgi/Tetstr1/463740/TSEL_000789.t1